MAQFFFKKEEEIMETLVSKTGSDFKAEALVGEEFKPGLYRRLPGEVGLPVLYPLDFVLYVRPRLLASTPYTTFQRLQLRAVGLLGR